MTECVTSADQQEKLNLIYQNPELLRLKDQTLQKIKALGYQVEERGEFPFHHWKLNNGYQEVEMTTLDALIHFHTTHAALSIKVRPVNNNVLEIGIMFGIVAICGIVSFVSILM